MHKLYEGALVLGGKEPIHVQSREAINYASDYCPHGFRTVRAQKIVNKVKWFGKLWVPDAITDDEAFRVADGYFGRMIDREMGNGK